MLRNQLIHLAHTLPAGSEDQKALLKVLKSARKPVPIRDVRCIKDIEQATGYAIGYEEETPNPPDELYDALDHLRNAEEALLTAANRMGRR
jgi:hypothetical protein